MYIYINILEHRVRCRARCVLFLSVLRHWVGCYPNFGVRGKACVYSTFSEQQENINLKNNTETLVLTPHPPPSSAIKPNEGADGQRTDDDDITDDGTDGRTDGQRTTTAATGHDGTDALCKKYKKRCQDTLRIIQNGG